jgi:ribosomal protein L11 methyltransferase
VYAALKPNGIYIASGVYKNKETDVEEGLIRSGFEIVEKRRDEEWIAFVARKPQVG